MSTLKVTHLQNESNSAPSISISNAVGGGVTFAGISTFHGSIRLGTDIEGHPSADDLTIATSGDTGMTIRSGASNQGSLYFSDATSGNGEFAGWLRYSHQDSNMTIGVAENERLRITSGGDICIGGQSSNYADSPLEVRKASGGGDVAIRVTNNTTTNGSKAGIIFTNSTGDYTSAGIAHLRNDNALIFYNGQSAEGGGFDNATERLRITSAGNIGVNELNPTNPLVVKQSSGNVNLELHSESSGRGAQIMTHNDHATFYHGISGDTSGHYIYYTANTKDHVFHTDNTERFRITSAGKLLLPSSSPGIQFGSPDNPDAGGAPLNIDISSQTLDDYEEGTFTPTVLGLSLGTAVGHYVKVGTLVTCIFYIDIGTKSYINGGVSTQSLQIQLPFTNGNATTAYAGLSIGNIRFIDFSGPSAVQFSMNIGGSSNLLTGRFIKHNSNFVDVTLGDLFNSFSIHASATYQTT